jgi:hypothetical protein
MARLEGSLQEGNAMWTLCQTPMQFLKAAASSSIQYILIYICLYFISDYTNMNTYIKAGNVVCAEVFYDPETGRSKGGGIVEFKTKSEADVAIDRLNKSTLKGRVISVREDRDDFSVGGAAHGTRVYAGNLSWQVDWYDLKVCGGVMWVIPSLFSLSLYTDICV